MLSHYRLSSFYFTMKQVSEKILFKFIPSFLRYNQT